MAWVPLATVELMMKASGRGRPVRPRNAAAEPATSHAEWRSLEIVSCANSLRKTSDVAFHPGFEPETMVLSCVQEKGPCTAPVCRFLL